MFLASAAVVVRSGLRLSNAGDRLAEATGIGRLWVGTILLALATSLPELVTNLAAVHLDAPDLAGAVQHQVRSLFDPSAKVDSVHLGPPG